MQESQKAVQVACKKNLVWILARRANQENQAIPSWTGFNIRTRDHSISEDVVGYLPTINAPATEMNTVFEILNRSELIRKELLLESIVVVMDQALYAKAAELFGSKENSFPTLSFGWVHSTLFAMPYPF